MVCLTGLGFLLAVKILQEIIVGVVALELDGVLVVGIESIVTISLVGKVTSL